MTDKEYWKTPIAKIMGNGVHDSIGPINLLSSYGNFIIEELTSDPPNVAEALRWANKIKEQTKRANEAIDFMYKEVKELTINNDKQTSERSTSEPN